MTQKGGFPGILLDVLAASAFGNILAHKTKKMGVELLEPVRELFKLVKVRILMLHEPTNQL